MAGYGGSMDPRQIEQFLASLQGQQGGGQQRRGGPVPLPPPTRPKNPVLNALKRILPGVDSRGEKAKKQIPQLLELLQNSQDPNTQQFVGIANALKGSNSVQARDILLQAASPRQQAPLPPGLQELMFRANASEDQVRNLARTKLGDPESVARIQGKTALEVAGLRKEGDENVASIQGKTAREVADTKVAGRAPTKMESLINFVKDRYEGEEQGTMLRSLSRATTPSDLYLQHPEVAAKMQRDALAKVQAQAAASRGPTATGLDALDEGARTLIRDAQASLLTDYGDIIDGNVKHLNSVLEDDQFNSHFGSWDITNWFRQGSESERDFVAKLKKVSGSQMLEAIKSFSGAISDKDLEIAAEEATSLFSKGSVSPELARNALTKLRDAFEKSLAKRKRLAGIKTQAEYDDLLAENLLPSGYTVTEGEE